MSRRHVVVVCTGNVARSPALGTLLAEERPDLRVTSAAVGAKAAAGRRMARPMRELMTGAGYGAVAQAHRSRLLADVLAAEHVDLVVCCAEVHVKRLALIPGAPPFVPVKPPLPDPAFGGQAAYERVFPMIRRAAAYLGFAIPPDDDGRNGDALRWFSEHHVQQVADAGDDGAGQPGHGRDEGAGDSGHPAPDGLGERRAEHHGQGDHGQHAERGGQALGGGEVAQGDHRGSLPEGGRSAQHQELYD